MSDHRRIVQLNVHDVRGTIDYGRTYYKLWYSNALRCIKGFSYMPDLTGDTPMSLDLEYIDCKTFRRALVHILQDVDIYSMYKGHPG